MRKIGIFGSGGFGREVLSLLDHAGLGNKVASFFETDEIWKDRTVSGLPVLPLSQFDPAKTELVLALGNPAARRAVRDSLPPETRYPTIIHPTVVQGRSIELGTGVVICAGCILTCDIQIGAHVQLNLSTTVGHDCSLEDFVTTAPAVNISGRCQIGTGTYMGTNASLREGLSIAAESVIGMGAVVVSSISRAGIFVGNPAKSRSV